MKIGCTAGVGWKICNRLSLKTGTRCYAKVLLKPRRKWKKLSPSSLCWYNLVDAGAHRLAWWCRRPVLQSVVSVSRLWILFIQDPCVLVGEVFSDTGKILKIWRPLCGVTSSQPLLLTRLEQSLEGNESSSPFLWIFSSHHLPSTFYC